MKSVPALMVCLALLLSSAASPAKGSNDAAVLKAGAAIADITPDVAGRRTPMAGYSARLGMPSRGVHDPLSCRALAITDGSESAAIISCDLVTISAALRDKVISALSGTDFNDRNILLTATHTHAGPGSYDPNLVFQAALFGAYDEDFTAQMAEKIGDAVKEAAGNFQPATISFAETSLPNTTRNRRDPGAYDAISRRSKENSATAGPTDPALSVIRVGAVNGEPIAVLFHFATHATILGPDNMMISAEWPGVARERIERALPGAAAIFINGAEGDQTPCTPADGADDWTWVERIGQRVGDAVVGSMSEMAPVAGAPVLSAVTRREVRGPGRVMGIPLSSYSAHSLFPAFTLQVVRLGEIAFLAVPVELTSEPGQALKESARGGGIEHPLVVGPANDFFWYCAGPGEFKNGSSYEPGNTIYGEMEAGLLIGEELLLLHGLTGR